MPNWTLMTPPRRPSAHRHLWITGVLLVLSLVSACSLADQISLPDGFQASECELTPAAEETTSESLLETVDVDEDEFFAVRIDRQDVKTMFGTSPISFSVIDATLEYENARPPKSIEAGSYHQSASIGSKGQQVYVVDVPPGQYRVITAPRPSHGAVGTCPKP